MATKRPSALTAGAVVAKAFSVPPLSTLTRVIHWHPVVHMVRDAAAATTKGALDLTTFLPPATGWPPVRTGRRSIVLPELPPRKLARGWQ